MGPWIQNPNGEFSLLLEFFVYIVLKVGGGKAGSEVAWRGWVQVATSRCAALFSANKGIAAGPAPRHAGRRLLVPCRSQN